MYRALPVLRPVSSAGLRPQLRPPAGPLATSLRFRRQVANSPPKPTSAGTPGDGAKELEKRKSDYRSTASDARDEIRDVTRDVAQMISGRSKVPLQLGAQEISSHSHSGSVVEDFVGITKGLFLDVPKPAMLFGVAGLIPYIGTSLGTVFLAREASQASQGIENLTGLSIKAALDSLHTLEHVQITYGAIILSFLGALHWGMEFSKLGGEQGYARLAVGTIPVLFAWPTTFLTHGIALAVQWFGFTGMWFLDQRASTNGWTPRWYATYRFYLSIIVGFSIIGTFAGTGYYGAGAGAVTSLDTHKMHHTTERVSSLKRLDRVKEKNYPPKDYARAGKSTGTVPGDIEVDENDDSYLKLRNIANEEKADEQKQEEDEKKKTEKAKNQEYQDKRDEYQMDVAPGNMKNTAPDRTGVNRNVAGGKSERPDEEKQSEQMGTGPVGSRTEFGTKEDTDFKEGQKEEHGDDRTDADETMTSQGKDNAKEKTGGAK